MKYILLLLFLLFIPSLGFCQTDSDWGEDNLDIVKTEYTQLDKISRSFNPLFGSSSGSIEFILVKLVNLSSEEVIYGVEVNIDRIDKEIISRGIGFSSIGSLWGASSIVTARNLSSAGHIFLLREDVENVISFLNDVVGATGIEQDNYKVYTISLYNSFELGMLYDGSWSFIFNIDNASYSLEKSEGMQMLQKLNEFMKFMIEKET